MNPETPPTNIVDFLASKGIYPTRWQPHRPKDAYLYLCPFHADTNPSFSVHEDYKRWKCWTCGSGGIKKLTEMFGDDYTPPVRPTTKEKKTRTKGGGRFAGCTLSELAQAKNLPIEHLRSLGWQDATYAGKSVVAIPYQNGIRYRVGLTGDRFRWGKNTKVRLYGLDKLEEYRSSGWVLFVEGETDVAAGRLMDLPVIGVPGAATWKDEWVHQFQGCQIYVWKEPDQAGETFAKKLAESFWDVRIVEAPEGIKDLCELHDQCGDGAQGFFLSFWQRFRKTGRQRSPKMSELRIVISYLLSVVLTFILRRMKRPGKDGPATIASTIRVRGIYAVKRPVVNMRWSRRLGIAGTLTKTVNTNSV